MGSNQTNKIHIEVDPELRSLLPKYLENRKKDLDNLRTAHKESDFEFIRKTSHTIKGHGSSYGFIRLTEICILIERAAQKKDAKHIDTLLKEYDEYVNNIELT